MVKLRLNFFLEKKFCFSTNQGDVKALALLFDNKDWGVLKNYPVRDYFYKKRYYLQWTVKAYDNDFDLFSEAWFAEENKRMSNFEYWKVFFNPHPVNSKLWVEENNLRKLDVFKKNQEELRKYTLIVNLFILSLRNFLPFPTEDFQDEFKLFLKILDNESVYFFSKTRKLDFLKTNLNLFKKVGELNRVRELLLEMKDEKRTLFSRGLDLFVYKTFFLGEYFSSTLRVFSSEDFEEVIESKEKIKKKSGFFKGWVAVEDEQARPELRKVVRSYKKRFKSYIVAYFNHIDFYFFTTDFLSLIGYLKKLGNIEFLEKAITTHVLYEEATKISALDIDKIIKLNLRKSKALGIGEVDTYDYQEEETEFEEDDNEEDDLTEDIVFSSKNVNDFLDSEFIRFGFFLGSEVLSENNFLLYVKEMKQKFSSEFLVDFDDLVFKLGLNLIKEKNKESEMRMHVKQLFCFFSDDKPIRKEGPQSLISNFLEERKLAESVKLSLKTIPALSDLFEKDREMSYTILEAVELQQKEYIFFKLKSLKEQGKVNFFGKYLEFLDHLFKVNKIFNFNFEYKASVRKYDFWYSYDAGLEESLQQARFDVRELISLKADLLNNFGVRWDQYVAQKNPLLHKYNIEFYSKLLRNDGSFGFSQEKMFYNNFNLFVECVGFLSKIVFFFKEIRKG